MRVNYITRKSVRMGIKQGMSLSDFCLKYDCSETEFTKKIQSLYLHNATQIMRELKQSASKHHGKLVRRIDSIPESAPQPEPQSTPQPAPRSVSEPVATPEISNAQPSAETYQISVQERLENLKKQEATESAKLSVLENSYRSFLAQRREHTKSLQTLLVDLKRIEDEFKSKVSESQSIIAKNDEISVNIASISETIHSQEKLLAQLRSDIQSLSMVAVCVYADGTISLLEERFLLKLNDCGWEDLFSQLVERDECQELKAKDIRLLSKVLCIVKNSQLGFNIVFENSEIEPVFNLLSSEL